MLRNIGYLFFVVVFAVGTYFTLTGKGVRSNEAETPPTEFVVKQYSNDQQTSFNHAPTRVTPKAFEDDSGTVFVQLSEQADDGEVIVIEPAPSGGLINWITWFYRNLSVFATILVGLIGVIDPIIRWTPTEKDNNLLRIIQSWLDTLFPNRRSTGGSFTAFNNTKDAPPVAYVPPKKE